MLDHVGLVLHVPGSDDDNIDGALDLEEDEAAEETLNKGYAMYEKVHRSKSRWRCNLRYGVIVLDDKEYMFNKAMADLQF
jgi:transcription initiation factor TFIIA large subunit